MNDDTLPNELFETEAPVIPATIKENIRNFQTLGDIIVEQADASVASLQRKLNDLVPTDQNYFDDVYRFQEQQNRFRAIANLIRTLNEEVTHQSRNII